MINGDTLAGIGQPGRGLTGATFTNNVRFRETRAGRGQAAMDRTITAQTLDLQTAGSLDAIDRATFSGGVTVKDARTRQYLLRNRMSERLTGFSLAESKGRRPEELWPPEYADRISGTDAQALASGAPPHAGAAPGLDRICMLITGSESLRDVIPFPKQRGGDLMTGAPTRIDDLQLKELHIRSTAPDDKA